MTTLASQPTNRSDREPAITPLRADCVADSAGGLTFDLPDSGESGPAHLVLYLRGTEEEVRLPLTPVADGRLRAALPSGVDLPEGRWDAYVQVADGEPRRLTPGLNDLRALVDRAPAPTAARVVVRLPYGTKHGNLSVRGWERSPHAEAGELHIGEGELTVSVKAYGVEPTPDAYVELVRREEPYAQEKPYAPEGTSPAVRAELAGEQGVFHFTVAYGALGPGTWELWLRPEGEAGPRVRIARLLDDIVEKTPVFMYPKARVETERGPVEATAHYTADNDLSVTVTAVS
ncbi:hypothetical protein PV416_22150 [Streptomyces ipomoeae]|uniref:Transferase n=1 Tax=Streptomyces ipomoeae 91-03 TaxID=698759 RepID=L1L7P2_9ACTN|nr:hypothetical protein [Streptomyces ipomoeae]EKX69066.1 hypothetical protein STRIP9103_01821 [Streptomyces ipomoeae 91-03]MDX2696212.1 hypothetical protein [Streptomyces ipomoeae]MDX2823732.1 hypothetical protein [Streptomyces ipomoeae]MDX2839976.1 hypothetical protein [Streptomyces ipomoeae]MDX2876306.1 hypothetical protein [Streptomyces ipomoeae]